MSDNPAMNIKSSQVGGGGYYRRNNRTNERYTPLELYQEWDSKYHFETDPCTDPTNRLGCKVFFTKDDDGLSNVDKWRGNVWINPPYDHTTGKWVKAALEYSTATGNTVVMLLKNATEVKWFHRNIWDKQTGDKRPGVDSIHYHQNRIRFVDVKGNEMAAAPFGSMVVVFGRGGGV